MNFAKMREILNIVEKYSDLGHTPFAGAEHDVIYLELSTDKVSEHDADGKRLLKLGCQIDETDTTWCIYV